VIAMRPGAVGDREGNQRSVALVINSGQAIEYVAAQFLHSGHESQIPRLGRKGRHEFVDESCVRNLDRADRTIDPSGAHQIPST